MLKEVLNLSVSWQAPITSPSLICPDVGSTRDVAMENACYVPISQLLSFEWCFFFMTQTLIHRNILASFTPSNFFFVSVCIHSLNMAFLDTLWKKWYCVFLLVFSCKWHLPWFLLVFFTNLMQTIQNLPQLWNGFNFWLTCINNFVTIYSEMVDSVNLTIFF